MEGLHLLAVCAIAAVLALILRQHRPEYALLVSLAAGVIVVGALAARLAAPIAVLRERLESSGADLSLFSAALKALCVGYISEFIADSCRDCGETALAAKAELAGRCAIFLLSLPLIIKILETALSFL